MNNNSTTIEHDSDVIDEIDSTTIDGKSKVILLDDSIHSIHEVTIQIAKAINCNLIIAYNKTMEVHNSGKSMVYAGDVQECLSVSAVLEEINLRTEIVC